jgi:hypothetical protein
MLDALHGKGEVLIADVMRAVYGPRRREWETLRKLITRTNKALAEANIPYEISKREDKLILAPL